jgi:hypothetical protein
MTDHDQLPYGLVDGNALAGPLSDLFAVDLTAVSVTCAACWKRQPLAALEVYAGGPALIARCRSCQESCCGLGALGRTLSWTSEALLSSESQAAG